MTRRTPISLMLAALSLACATSPAATPGSAPAATPPATQTAPPPAAVAQSAAFNPVGTFDFLATVPDGSQAPGSFTITGTPGAYRGTIERGGQGTDLSSISIDGQTLTIGANIPEGPVLLTLTFTGNEFSGKWAIEGAEGPITGKRRN
jgi:hypothetical protein